jgi:hypothetical protein
VHKQLASRSLFEMPTKKTWLLRVAEIREELKAVEAPVIDRAMCERIFGVGRRRALQLMHSFGGWQSGQAFLVDRLALLQQLEPFQNGEDLLLEQRRRQRLSETLEQTRRYRAAARVILPVAGDTRPQTMVDLPPGVHLQPGSLTVEFGQAEELLAKLFELAQAAAHDFDGFRRMASG